jgi:hypothetical protein
MIDYDSSRISLKNIAAIGIVPKTTKQFSNKLEEQRYLNEINGIAKYSS